MVLSALRLECPHCHRPQVRPVQTVYRCNACGRWFRRVGFTKTEACPPPRPAKPTVR